MPKINLPGIKLRQKSTVHRSIIDTSGRRKNSKTKWVQKMIRKKNETTWGKNGEIVHSPKLIVADINKIGKNSNIMILGPGEGAEVLFMSDLIKKKNSKIDTLGLGNQLSTDAKKIIRKDYSPGLEKIKSKDLFEHFNHLKFVKKYDYIYSAYGPILHTNYKEISILKVASMLRPGGIARIVPWFNDIDSYNKNIKNVKDYLKETGHADALDIEFEENSLIIRRVK
jgi:SAM-dependent methyltransferase